ncbi:MAG TPA: S-4TM family putative pore-forming effector [Candidatus Paceibacterota bacterium]|jgi:hypothetical protein
MNDIPEKQNQPNQLALLSAQRRLYSASKKLFFWRTIIALCVATVGSYLVSNITYFGSYLALAIVSYIVIDIYVLKRKESEHRETAAAVQELFDTRLYELPWNDFVAKKKPDDELIALWARPLELDNQALKDWYPREVGKADLDFARFVCQRTNLWWDSTLRQNYVRFLIFILIATGVVLALLSIYFELSVAAALVQLLPLLPLANLLQEQVRDHWETYSQNISLKGQIDEQIEKMVRREVLETPSVVSRIFQDEIFRHRRKSSLILDYFYWKFRPKQEEQMQFSAESKVTEYLNAKPA